MNWKLTKSSLNANYEKDYTPIPTQQVFLYFVNFYAITNSFINTMYTVQKYMFTTIET